MTAHVYVRMNHGRARAERWRVAVHECKGSTEVLVLLLQPTPNQKGDELAPSFHAPLLVRGPPAFVQIDLLFRSKSEQRLKSTSSRVISTETDDAPFPVDGSTISSRRQAAASSYHGQLACQSIRLSVS